MAKRPRAGDDPERRMSLAEHLIELRRRLTISAVAILIGAIGGFFVAEKVIDLLIEPINAVAEDRNIRLTYTMLTEQIDLMFQIAFVLSILATSPIWLYQVLAFFVPGLTKRERKYTLGFLFTAVPMFLGGGFVGLLIFPHMVALLTGFSSNALATTNLSARPYYDFVIKLVLAVGVAFVLPVFLVLLNFLGVISAKAILKGWRVAILVITVFCATATPATDLVSMFILAVPMVLLYFAAAGVALWHDRGVAKRESQLEAELA